MKRNIIILFTIGLLMTLGCKKFPFGNDFLTKAPGVDVTQDTIFSNIMYAERFLWGAYYTMNWGIDITDNSTRTDAINNDLLEAMTDFEQSFLTWGGVYNSYYQGNYSASTENSSVSVKCSLSKGGQLEGIRKSYIFLQNIDRVPNVDPAYRNQLKAEARMIIAFQYCELYRNFGGMPWLNKAFDINNLLDSMPRLTAQATCDSIVAVINKAIPNLPWVVNDPETWEGRFTKAAAMGLKARLLLFNASPLFNSAAPYLDGAASQKKLTWHGVYNPNLWKNAMDAAHELIAHCESTGDYRFYHLAGNTFRQDFQQGYFRRGSSELLISGRNQYFKEAFSGNNFFATQGAWGAGGLTDDYVKKFAMSDGKPITDPTSGYDSTNPYINRDPRLYETILVNGDEYRSRTAELYIGGRERSSLTDTKAPAGYTLRKFLLDNNSATIRGAIIQWPFMRLEEIYLTYAEADNEFNSGPSAEAYRCVNAVRNRVGLGDLPAGLTQAQFREAVITERSCEFGFELVHWYDLVRWKRDYDFTKRLHGMNINRSGTGPYTYTYTQTLLPQRYWQRVWSPKWYLSAFPLDEISKGYGLVQNPGW